MPIRKGQSLRKLTAEQQKVLLLCAPEERSTLLRRWRQRDSAKGYRKQNAEACLQRTRAWRKKAVQAGYYRAGGKGYRGTVRSEKRRLYFQHYNHTVRKQAKTSND